MVKASGARKLLRWFLLLFGGAISLILLVILLFRFVNPPTSAFILGYQLSHSQSSVAVSYTHLTLPTIYSV